MSDNVVLIRYREADDEVKRSIAVIKTRASGHDPRVRDFTIDVPRACGSTRDLSLF